MGKEGVGWDFGVVLFSSRRMEKDVSWTTSDEPIVARLSDGVFMFIPLRTTPDEGVVARWQGRGK